MRICFASLYYDVGAVSVDGAAYLATVPIHRELPRALAAKGHEVQVVHHYPLDLELADGPVRHRFVAEARALSAPADALARLLHRDPVLFQPALRSVRAVAAWRPDLIHFHGLTLTWNLALTVLGTNAPLVVQYHGGYPATNPVARRAQGFALRRATRTLFTTTAHAQPFVDAGVVRRETVVELMETSSTFRPAELRAEARRKTDMPGAPVFLWAGRLAAIKDPFTALRGFERILAARPHAQLYLHYLTDELLPELRAFVSARPTLAPHVHFRGRAPATDMEAIYGSADFLLQASQREFSGCAVLEAMACGAIPVVTDIPSFEAMTAGGKYGVLFPRGDDGALARGVLALPADTAAVASDVRAHFERTLSFPALAERLDALYRELRP